MSSVLVVGGDHIQNVKNTLQQFGVTDVDHWSGRKPGDQHKKIPQHTSLIVLLTDWVNHSLTYSIKHKASKRGIQVVQARNGGHLLSNQLQQSAALGKAKGSVESECSRLFSMITIVVLTLSHKDLSVITNPTPTHC